VIDPDRVAVCNSPAANPAAAASSNPDFHCLVYKEAAKEGDQNAYLAIVANLGAKEASATITLAPDVLGMSGEYQVSRIDSQTGAAAPCGFSRGAIVTSRLPQWGIEGFKLTKSQ
jgi:hypothetical protein